MGWMKPPSQVEKEKEKDEEEKYYDIWSNEDEVGRVPQSFL